ncbi:MAG TPA: M67 family metallopeptidase [Candidatus Limnocylindria bacterium]
MVLPRAVAEEMLAHARAELPNEACGMLSGSVARGTVTTFHPARNAHVSPRRFSLDPRDQVRITYAVEDAGEEVVAIFHSHTGSPAVPSAADRREATYPEAFHVIASLVQPDGSAERWLRAWRVRDGRADEVPLELV